MPGGDLAERVAAMRRDEEGSARLGARSLLRLARNVILLVKDLLVDPRVPAWAKVVPLGVAVGYTLAPVRVMPPQVPLPSWADEVLVACWALRRFLRSAGYECIYDRWRGSTTELAVLLALIGPDEPGPRRGDCRFA